MENDMMAIVMAAGKGTRMKSKNSKLVQKIYGKEIEYLNCKVNSCSLYTDLTKDREQI